MPQFQRIAIFSGNANPALANNIARHMKRPLGDIEVRQHKKCITSRKIILIEYLSFNIIFLIIISL